jgi:hypothetical protein
MLKRTIAFLAVQTCVLALAGAVSADEVPANFLPGTWGIGGPEACGSAGTEHITFDQNGTFRVFRDGEATAVGFWALVEDILDLHIIASPASFDDPTTTFDDALGGLVGQYQYFYAKGLLFDIEPNAFRMVATMGDRLRGANYARCP